MFLNSGQSSTSSDLLATYYKRLAAQSVDICLYGLTVELVRRDYLQSATTYCFFGGPPRSFFMMPKGEISLVSVGI